MKGRFLCFLLALQILSWVSEATRPFPPPDGMSHQASSGPEEEPAPHSSPPYTRDSQKGSMVTEGMSESMKEAYDRGVSRIGSSPPSCEHKCYGCTPCEATQVPSTSSRHSHLGIQYTNYEPESWKCKCGVSIYSP